MLPFDDKTTLSIFNRFFVHTSEMRTGEFVYIGELCGNRNESTF